MAKKRDALDEAGKIEQDAKGQFAPKQSGRHNDGVASARASVVTGTEDATFDTKPEGGSGEAANRFPKK